MKKTYLTIIVLFLVGCTGTTEYMHTPSEADGTIHLYRGYEFNASGMGAVFYVDGQNILKLGVKEYAEVPIRPGKHLVAVKADQTTKMDGREITVKPNEHYHFRIKANPSRLGPQLLIPIIEVAFIPGFLLIQSDEDRYKNESAGFTKKTVEFTSRVNDTDTLVNRE